MSNKDEDSGYIYYLYDEFKKSSDKNKKGKIREELYQLLCGVDILDYIDHLVEQYKNSGDKDRKKNIKNELGYFGINIESESVTTEKVVDNSIAETITKTTKETIVIPKDNIKTDDRPISDIKIDYGTTDSILSYLNLPEDNFIMIYINTMCSLTSAYPEWHFAMVIDMLSIVSNRKLKLELRHRELYPNVWFFLLGLSTISQKTTAIGLGEEIIKKSLVKDLMLRRLPGSFSPEGFLEDLSENKNGYIWKDEAGDLLKSIKTKEYMSGMRDILCDTYDGKVITRSLKGKKTYIHDPFLNMILATTPDTFRAYTDILDLTSGYLFRFLYLYPEYEKVWMPETERTQEHRDKIEELTDILRRKIRFISNIGKDSANMTFGPGSLDYYQTWTEKLWNRAVKNKNDSESAFIGRLENYALKLAMLFSFGENKVKFEISKDIMITACSLSEHYFLPTALKIVGMVGIDEKNKINLVLGVIKRHGGDISRSDLLRKTRIKAKELDEICDILEHETGEIRLCTVNKTKRYKQNA